MLRDARRVHVDAVGEQSRPRFGSVVAVVVVDAARIMVEGTLVQPVVGLVSVDPACARPRVVVQASLVTQFDGWVV